MLTSFRSDSTRVEKEMQISSFPGRYALEQPGPGLDLPMVDDVQIRMQTWGANRRDNFVNLESDLRCMTRHLNRDNVQLNEYQSKSVASQPVSHFHTQNPYVLESRASHPAWIYRNREQPRWEEPWINPQANIEKPFYDNIQTRILEKDYYKEPYQR